MKFDELDAEMREFETRRDQIAMNESFLVARLDGRNFTKLTERMRIAKPFDDRMCAIMSQVTMALMKDFLICYGYTQSDEISLLFAKGENSFNRKYRKLISVLAGEASAAFTYKAKVLGSFDCRLSELPTKQRVVDYFRWRGTDAQRNALTSYCFWTLVNDSGQSKHAAAGILDGLNEKEKRIILKARGIDFDDVPIWKRRGIGMYYLTKTKTAVNLHTGKEGDVERRILMHDRKLPDGEEYSEFLRKLVDENFE